MRKRRKLKLKKKKKKGIIQPLIIRKEWITRMHKYSVYPYLFIVSCFRRNVFFNVTNYRGQTKYWTSSGRYGFKGKTKIEHMALITVTESFIKKIWTHGIRRVILIFKNYNRHHRAIIRGIRFSLKKKYYLQFISLTIKMQTVFNGCRNKKKRRR